MKFLKYLILILIISLFSYFVFSAKAEIPLNEINNLNLENSLKLKTPINKIYKSEIYSDSQNNQFVKYHFYTNEILPQNNELVNLKTNNSYTISLGQNKYKTRIFSGESFIKVNNLWYQSEFATTTLQAWLSQSQLGFFQKLKNWFFASVLADTFFSGAGDGNVNNTSGVMTWAQAHNATIGNVADYTGETSNTDVYYSSGGWKIVRSFLPFDTSALPDTANVTATTLNVYIPTIYHDHDEAKEYLAVISTTQANPTELVTEDFDQQGTTVLSDSPLINTLSINNYNTFTLNGDGLDAINLTGYSQFGLRVGYDIENVEPGSNSGDSGAVFRTSEFADTTSDPYLDVTYESGGEPPAEPIATTTFGVSTNYMEFSLILILFIGFFLLIGLGGKIAIKWLKNLLYVRF